MDFNAYNFAEQPTVRMFLVIALSELVVPNDQCSTDTARVQNYYAHVHMVNVTTSIMISATSCRMNIYSTSRTLQTTLITTL